MQHKNHDRVKSDSTSAQLYTQRKPRKHQFEMQMVCEAFQMLPSSQVRNVLDAPCGVGRLSLWLAQKGYVVTAVDLGDAAVELTRKLLHEQNFQAEIECQDIFNMRFKDGEFDATVCFRLLHHFNEIEDQKALIAEICRVSAKYVVISYFSPYSFTSLRRKLRKVFTGKPVKQNPLTLAQLKERFSSNDFQLLGHVRRSGFLHSLQLAVFEKTAAGAIKQPPSSPK